MDMLEEERSLRFISAVNNNDETIEFGDITVLVGPNNSGKSQTLRDLRAYALGALDDSLTLFKTVNVRMPSKERLRSFFNVVPSVDAPNAEVIIGIEDSLVKASEINTPKSWIESLIEEDSELSQLQTLGTFLISYLHAGTRFELTAPQEAYDSETETPTHLLHEFFAQEPDKQALLREAFLEAFDHDIALDWTPMKRWYFKVEKEFGVLSDSKSKLKQQLSSGRQLKEQGDGYQAFTGVLMAALVFPERTLLLDEPEAFLHPKQARVLGRLLGELSRDRSAQIIVSTHSSEFMWGVMSGNERANVLRLNRSGDNTKYTQVSAETLEELTKSPLLSSQPVLESLFHQGIVVCEGDPDRAVYQFVAHRIIAKEGEDLLFIHTNGKHAADMPIELLKNIGVPVAVIVDIDIINNKTPLDKIVKALTEEQILSELEDQRRQICEGVILAPEEQLLTNLINSVKEWSQGKHSDLHTSRRMLERAIQEVRSKWTPVKKQGVYYFKDEQLNFVKKFIDDLASMGLFVVPCGELEQWFNIEKKKGKEWNYEALKELQEDNCPPELKSFIEQVIKFLSGVINED